MYVLILIHLPYNIISYELLMKFRQQRLSYLLFLSFSVRYSQYLLKCYCLFMINMETCYGNRNNYKLIIFLLVSLTFIPDVMLGFLLFYFLRTFFIR